MLFIIDFDGTLINCNYRIYKLFSDLIFPCKISFDKYINLKKRGIKNNTILINNFQFNEQELLDFNVLWFKKIESKFYLQFNQLFDFTKEALSILSSLGTLYLVSNRRYDKLLKNELEELDLYEFLKSAHATLQNASKSDIIKRNIIIDESSFSFMIGDTEEDIIEAKKIGINSVAVLSGVRDKDRLISYSPNYLFDNILKFSKFLVKNND